MRGFPRRRCEQLGRDLVSAAPWHPVTPLGSPAYDYWLIGSNESLRQLLQLDARTGKQLRHFQTVHHDLWDYDLTAALQLLAVTRNGKRIDAVAQGYQAWIPFRVRSRDGRAAVPTSRSGPVPASTMPGEQAWPRSPSQSACPSPHGRS